MHSTLDFRNANSLWCSVLVETLARLGVRHAVVSPGSRSTPLTFAFVRHPKIDTTPVLDERSAAFFALGLARRTHEPVALVCTSGTAVANHLPAVVEASEGGVPLLVLTADRPPEMRACASGQTIDQQKIFGGFVRLFHEVAVPETRPQMLDYLRQTVANAVETARRAPRGPVHLNLPFRDPLPPIADDETAALEATWGAGFFDHLVAPEVGVSHMRLLVRASTARGLIVAGPANPSCRNEYTARLRELAERLRWPVIADALSPLRHGGGFDVPVVSCYDAILRHEATARDLVPRQVVALGDWPTSKVLRGWLARSGAETVLISSGGVNRDALHGRTRTLAGEATWLVAEGTPPRDDAYTSAWARAEAAARDAIDVALLNEPGMVEPRACRLLADLLPEGARLFVASSMPVRDVEYFWPVTDKRFEFHFNRGANGIDGTLSTALGVAHEADGPAVLLTGDLAFLHDTNGLLSAPKLRGALTVVLVDNHGGGIFEHLPVARFDPPFEQFFATPQDVDFARLCEAHGIAYEAVPNWERFAGAISTSWVRGVRVLHLRTDRKLDAALRRRVLDAASRAAAAAIR
jgi:2-succinyl-5-enolpyruvyl-6-hydroxy-3-cyclohexene-1-carboxylate synthase